MYIVMKMKYENFQLHSLLMHLVEKIVKVSENKDNQINKQNNLKSVNKSSLLICTPNMSFINYIFKEYLFKDPLLGSS